MKRELKFRAWDKNRNEMVSSFLLAPTSPSWGPFVNRTDEAVDKLVNTHYLKQGDILGGHYTMLDWSDWYGLDNYEVMQFTGLKDKNGKEIYESDVIRLGGEELSTVVVWSEQYAGFGLRREGWMYTHFFGEAVDPTDCEVIGNIYEHKDLLQQ